jgi:hypothetical protein
MSTNEPRKRGRPANGEYPEKVFARLTPEQRAHIKREAARRGVTESEYLRRLIEYDAKS